MLREDRLVILDDFVATEGANLNARKKFKETKIAYKIQMAKAKKHIKAKEYDKAIDALTHAKSLVHEGYSAMLKEDSSVGSVLFSFITSGYPFFLRDMVTFCLAPLTLGIPFIVTQVKKIIGRINVVIKDWHEKDEKMINLNDINMYKNALKVRLNEYDKLIDKTISSVKEAKRVSGK